MHEENDFHIQVVSSSKENLEDEDIEGAVPMYKPSPQETPSQENCDFFKQVEDLSLSVLMESMNDLKKE